MTVQKNLVKNIYVGNGSTTQFPITFDVNTEHPEYIHVYLTNDDNITTETENFTVNLTAKTVTYPKEGQPLATGKKLVIMRELPLQQLLDLINQGDFFADDIEQAFDDLTMITQQLSEKLARAMVFSVEVADFDNIIPLAPGMSFRINDAGTGLELTEDPAKVLPQAQNLLQQTTQQANIATEKANAAAVSETNAAESESNAASSETNAAASEDMAQKWAESETSPDGEDDADSPTGETMSSKEWALYAKQIAQQIGNPVAEVTEDNGTVTVEKSDGTQNSFDIVKSVNGIAPTGGNVDINRKFYNSLASLGLSYSTVTFADIINALPVNSTLTFYVDVVTSQPTYAPNLQIPASGLVIVVKGSSNTVPTLFYLNPIVKGYTSYTGQYTTYNDNGFSGWQPMVLSVNAIKPNIKGNVTLPIDTYAPWKWSGNGITIDGFTITFTNGFKMAIWYMLFPNQTNQITVNYLTPFAAPPCVFGSIVVANGTIHLIPNVFNVTATSVTCVTNNTAGATATYWVAMGYDV